MKVLYRFLMLLVLALPLAGCGGGGAPGSTGSVDTGIVIKSVSITSTTPDLDVHVHVCSAGPPPVFEKGLFPENATITIDAAKLNPDITYDPFSASVEECTIVYRKANEDPASPIVESLTTYPNCTIVNGTNTCNVALLDVQRKETWWNDFSSALNKPAEYPTHYIASYTCRYVSRYGKEGTFKVEYDIWLADWETC